MPLQAVNDAEFEVAKEGKMLPGRVFRNAEMAFKSRGPFCCAISAHKRHTHAGAECCRQSCVVSDTVGLSVAPLMLITGHNMGCAKSSQAA